MFFERRGLRIVIAAIMAPLATACATQSLTPTLEIPKLPSALAGEPGRFEGRSADIYGLIASGALTCWFAANGQLKKSHIFHADADPQAKGGAVEIAILERDLVGPKPWGPKAFKVALSQSGDQTTIEVDNLKMPEATAARMRADVFHWAQGGKDCQLKPTEVAAPSPAPVVPKKKVRAKTVKKITTSAQ